MNQVLILLSVVLVISVNSQMQSFDAILQCGKLVKKMVGNYNKVVHQSKNP